MSHIRTSEKECIKGTCHQKWLVCSTHTTHNCLFMTSIGTLMTFETGLLSKFSPILNSFVIVTAQTSNCMTSVQNSGDLACFVIVFARLAFFCLSLQTILTTTIIMDIRSTTIARNQRPLLPRRLLFASFLALHCNARLVRSFLWSPGCFLQKGFFVFCLPIPFPSSLILRISIMLLLSNLLMISLPEEWS